MEERICKDCGKKFVLTDGEIDFFNIKGLSLPKRCKDCRSRKNPKSDNMGFSLQTDNYSVEKKKSHGFKFILSVVFAVAVAVAVIYGVSYQKNSETDYFKNNTSNYSAPQQYNNSSESSGIETGEKAEPKTEDSLDDCYTFRNSEFREEHFRKHGISMGFTSAEDYEKAASKVVSNANSLRKHEAEDNDMVYYLESTNEFVILSTDGYIRTYFSPDDGIEYYERQ